MNKEDIYLKTIKSIYNDVYKKINERYTNIFLCGGVSTNKNCIRDKVRSMIEEKNIRVLYPEDLFMEILTSNRSENLLSLENLLAENSDIICVLPESPGSLVELGAFTNNKKTLDKLFVFMDKKFEKDKSFIIMGPIKYIKNKQGSERVVFYDKKKLQKGVQDLLKKFKRVTKKDDIEITSILGQFYFIQVLLYFINSANNKELLKLIDLIYKMEGHDKNGKDVIFYSAIKFLYKNKFIVKDIEENSIMLTSEGRNHIENILYYLPIKNKVKLYDYIRYGIMLGERENNTSLENTI